jgi:predicted dehydrogenase
LKRAKGKKMEKLRICLIGAGRVGKVHALGLKNNIPDAELVAVVDKDEEAARRLAKEFELKIHFKDYEKALDWGKFDAVIITTPTFTHKTIAVSAAKAGKHIFCEKPMALNLEEADSMIQEAKRAKVKLQIGFMRRFDKSFLEAKKKVKQGAVGEPLLIKSTGRGPELPPEWAWDVKKSGGMLAEVGSHDFDTLRWFAESEFEKIYASAENYKCSQVKMKYSDFYDHAVVVARFQNGKVGMLDVGCPVGYGYDARMEVLGTKGVMFVGGINDNQVMVCTKGSGAGSSIYNSWKSRFKDAYIDELRHFVDVIKRNVEPFVTGENGKKVVEAITAANKSIQTGQPVSFLL